MSGSEDPALERLAASVPPAVRQICEQLESAGHQAVTVGGAVRDAMLGKSAGDWDVATSAKPDEVMALFRRTIPTGLQHGTVTVMTGAARGAPKEEAGVEVTTFRGEGAYSDGRRPDEVHFGVPLEEDLARRDLVVNAIAYSPARHQLIDPFGGREDLRLRRLRAVGVPIDRFLEDGLRVMRAVRFAAVLEFSIDEETEVALTGALPSLSKVSRERVTVELMKLLAAPRPSLGLTIAARRGVLENILPEVTRGLASWGRTAAELCRRVDEASVEARLGALVMDVAGKPATAPRAYDKAAQQAVDGILRRLKMKNTDTEKAAQVAAASGSLEVSPPLDEEGVRRVLAAAGRAHAAAVVEAWRADGVARPAGQGAQLAELGQRVVSRGDALSVAELAIAGADLISELGIPAGAEIGKLLRALLEQVLSDPTRNQRDALLEAARALRA